jgi:hypothetical protein
MGAISIGAGSGAGGIESACGTRVAILVASDGSSRPIGKCAAARAASAALGAEAATIR